MQYPWHDTTQPSLRLCVNVFKIAVIVIARLPALASLLYVTVSIPGFGARVLTRLLSYSTLLPSYPLTLLPSYPLTLLPKQLFSKICKVYVWQNK